MKLNLCAGGCNKEGFINVDKNAETRPDLLLDIVKDKWPYEDNSVDEVWLMHGLEHIYRKKWDFLFMETKRVLKLNGRFVLGYPEFQICLQNYLDNKGNRKDFWLQTIYGRRMWEGDEHVTAVESIELQQILESYGFYRVKYSIEEGEDYNSLMVAFKSPELITREAILATEMGLPGVAKSMGEVLNDPSRLTGKITEPLQQS